MTDSNGYAIFCPMGQADTGDTSPEMRRVLHMRLNLNHILTESVYLKYCLTLAMTLTFFKDNLALLFR